MSQCSESDALIRKETIYPGDKWVEFKNGSKVKFHYVTKTCNGKNVILDDSRKTKIPMELVLGKSFKMECWEVMIKKMAINEVAKFTVDKSLVVQYPFISKTLRDSRKPAEERKHCCGMTIQNEGMGYKDLDDIFNNPCNLEFTMELLSVEQPDDYEKESWQYNDDEKLVAVNRLKNQGNEEYKAKKYEKAEQSYRNALGMIEQLILKERPNDDEWHDLVKVKMPILLNYAQCRLLDKDYYAVIAHCTEVLKHDKNNVKALFRRAKAHVGAWNPNEAKEDFKQCGELDKSLNGAVQKELAALAELVRMHDLEDKLKYQKIF